MTTEEIMQSDGYFEGRTDKIGLWIGCWEKDREAGREPKDDF
jgi:hypothetical protein